MPAEVLEKENIVKALPEERHSKESLERVREQGAEKHRETGGSSGKHEEDDGERGGRSPKKVQNPMPAMVLAANAA